MTQQQQQDEYNRMIALTPDKCGTLAKALERALCENIEIKAVGLGLESEQFYASSGTDAARLPYTVTLTFDQSTGTLYAGCDCRYGGFQGDLPGHSGQPCKHIARALQEFWTSRQQQQPVQPAPVRYCGCGAMIEPDSISADYCGDCLEAQYDAQLENLEAADAAPRRKIEKKWCQACGQALAVCREGFCYPCLILAEREALISRYGPAPSQARRNNVHFEASFSCRKAG